VTVQPTPGDPGAGAYRQSITVLGPVFATEAVGGLQLAIADVVAQLRDLGWAVEQPVGGVQPPEGQARESAPRAVSHTGFRSGLARLGRLRGLFSLWHRLPLNWRRGIAVCFMSRGYFANAASTLRAVDRVLDDIDPRAPVLLFVDGAVPGTAALVTGRHRNTVIVSLDGLAMELRANWWRLARLVARLRLGSSVHDALYRQVAARAVRCAVFASRHWQREAIDAGLPGSVAQSIYFGIPGQSPVGAPARGHGNRLLWLGRLAPGKGLHLLLPCLPEIRRQVPGLTLTVYAAQGQAEYRERIMALVAQHELQDIVTFHDPVPRTALPAVYRDHDALFFYSRYRDPVALVMMEACAAGLPVLCSNAAADAALVQHGQTCWCYAPDEPETIVAGAVRILTDKDLRARLSRTACELVSGEFSLQAMGRRYDALLRGLDERQHA
jgi:glycosyltransferase involved in cell wall biosynthesis